jgi:uncharacterized protein (DUF2336 family)
MSELGALIEKVESFVQKAPAAERDAILVKVAHYYSHTSTQHPQDDVERFGELLEEFADLIESVALAKVSFYLAGVPNAPAGLVGRLAEHEDIVISGPLLAHSAILTEPALVSIARSRSQAHLLAISERQTLSEGLTDVLLDRGETQVLRAVARNAGARFSTSGVDKLVTLAKSDDFLAVSVIARRDMSPVQLKRVIAAASIKVRERLSRQNPHMARFVNEAVTAAAEETHRTVRSVARRLEEARILVGNLFRSGLLNEAAIMRFAQKQQFEEALVALALLTRNDVDEIARMVAEFGAQGTLTLAKAVGLSWETTEAILAAQHRRNGRAALVAGKLDNALKSFSKMNKDVARRVISFRMRAKMDLNPAEVLTATAGRPAPLAHAVGT